MTKSTSSLLFDSDAKDIVCGAPHEIKILIPRIWKSLYTLIPIAKTSLISEFRTQRVRKMAVINSYLMCEEAGLKESPDKANYNAIQKMTLNDVLNFNKSYIKDQKHVVVVLGNKDEVDFKALEKYGKITTLSLEEIFGY